MAKKTTPATRIFDKEVFKKSVVYNVKTLFRKTLEEATPQQIFQAVAYTVKDTIIDNWLMPSLKRHLGASFFVFPSLTIYRSARRIPPLRSG